MLKLGSHVSFASPDYLIGSIKTALSYDANALMIYLGPPQNTLRVETSKYKYEEYVNNYSNIISNENIIIHAPYIINPASYSKSSFAIEFLLQEISRMNYINAKYLVLHPGAYVGFTKEIAFETLIKTLKTIIDNTKDVVILLETMAGKGTELCSNFEEMNYVLREVNSHRLGVCLDTCHVWEAGYNIQNLDNFINDLEKHNLIDAIKVIHVNDSKNPLGAHKDRHENIGKGHIGLKAISDFIYHPKIKDKILILETPYVDDKPIYKEEIMLLKGNNSSK